MLMQKIREWTAGWVAGAIVGLIIITFAVWGVNFSDLGREPVIASVNGEKISLRQFQRTYGNYLRRVQEVMGRPATAESQIEYKKQTIDALVQSEIISQVSDEYGLQISNDKVVAAVKEFEAFGGDLGFDRLAYETGVMRMGLTPALFEQQLRRELITKQLEDAIKDSAFVANGEALRMARIDTQTRYLTYVVLLANDIKESIDVSDEDISEYYKTTGEGLMKEEEIKLAYIDLSVKKLTEQVEASEEDLESYYENHKDEYDEKHQRKVNIINFNLAPDADDETVAKAKAKAEKIKSLLSDGVSFSEVIEKHDDGEAPEMLFTEHGYLPQGVLPEAVDEAVFVTEEGELGDIVRADDGLYVFQVEDIKGGEKNTFAYAREKVEEDYKQSEAEFRYFDLADKLLALTYEHPDTLEVAADEIGFMVEESDFFNRGSAQGILADSKVLAAAFERELINSGENSEAIEIDKSRTVVMQVLEHRPAEKKPEEEVREQIIETLKLEGAKAKQQEKGDALKAALESDVTYSYAALADNFGITWSYAEGVEREDTNLNRKVSRVAFKAMAPMSGERTVATTEVNKDDYAVIVVTDVMYTDTLPSEAIDEARTKLLSSKTNSEWSTMVEELKRKADTVINEEIL